VTDYFSELENQLGRVTENGIPNRRRFGVRAPHPSVRLLAALASILVVAAAVAVALGTGRSVHSPPPVSRGSGGHARRGGNPVAAQSAGAGTGASAGGTAYCVNSITHARVACSPREASSPYTGGFPAIRPHPGSPIRLVAQLPLHAPSGGKRPAAVCRVVEQGGTFGITILATGLAANTKRNAYAVWLTNGPREDKLLGFVNPAVKTNGRLKTAGILPKNAFRYHKLLITQETQANPTAPGTVALEGPFHR